MKRKIRALTAGAAVAAAVGFSMVAAGSAAIASGGGGPTPPWESSISPAPNGSITFYNAEGQVVTGGSINAGGLGAYAVASTAAEDGYTKATLFMYTPVSGENPGLWSGEQISSSTTFPNASAPAPVGTTSNPVETNPGTETTIASYISAFPNTQTATGYVGLYDVRMKVSGDGIPPSTTYWDAVISVNTTNGTWSVDYPDWTQDTTTSLSANPPSPQTPPASLTTLTATVSPATDGTVSFWNGATQVGTTQTVSTSSASASVTTTPVGVTTYTAIFTPDVGSSDIGSSASLTYVASAPAGNPVLYGTSKVNSSDHCLAAFSGATTVSYAWQVDGTDIPGATTSKYTVPASQLGEVLTCSVTASNTSGSVSGTSSAATVVPAAPDSSTAASQVLQASPVIAQAPDSGVPTWQPVLYPTVKSGATVTCEIAFKGANTVTYAWQSNGTTISGVTTSTYQIPGSEYGKTLTCSAKATNTIGSVSGTSAGVKVALGAALKVVTKPVVSGPHEPGKAEKVTAGKWSPAASKVTYQWYVGSSKVKGATKSSFTVPKSTKKGAEVHCVVTASATGYANGTYTTPSVKIT